MNFETLREANELASEYNKLQRKYLNILNNRKNWQVEIVEKTKEHKFTIKTLSLSECGLDDFLDKKEKEYLAEMKRIQEQVEAL